ncbi:unnamed protein product [Diamesa serratosioi]
MLRVSLVFVAIVALNLVVKSEGKAFFFPFAFHFKHEHTNNGLQKTLTYASPFTGQTYSINWNTDWMFQHNGAQSNEITTTSTTTTVKPKLLRHVGHKDIHLKWELNYNKGVGTTTSTTSTSTTTTTTEEPPKIQEENIDTRLDALDGDIKTDDKSNDIDPTTKLE